MLLGVYEEMLVNKKIISLLAVLLVAACSSSEPKKDIAVVSGNGSGGRTPTRPVGGMDDSSAGLNKGVGENSLPSNPQQELQQVGDRVLFGYDQSDLSTEARAILDRQIEWLKRYPSLTITVEGHCDERGTREYNLALGDRRATSVRNYLVASGVEASRIQTISYGKERPAASGNDEASWAQNRRGVTVVN
ncbi:MAG: peptidoglycan-associated lipoprotein Pal [Alphaproteobacteria bacterium]